MGGEFKGRNFFMPAHIRPTQNVVRRAVFDIIGQRMDGLAVLDLFAGSGAVGLEAFSRGARTVVLIESDPACARVIQENLVLFGLDQSQPDARECVFMQGDAFTAIKGFSARRKRFDVVFIDPPYDGGLAKKALKTLNAYDILHPNSYLIIECGKREGLPYLDHDFQLMTERHYGKSSLVIYQSSARSSGQG